MEVLHTTMTNNTILIPFSELTGKESLIVKSKSSEYDIAMIKQKSEDWNALLMMCTHQSNPVYFDGDSFRCKVHFSEFTKEGVPFSGPARKPLVVLSIQKKNDHYQIDIPPQ